MIDFRRAFSRIGRRTPPDDDPRVVREIDEELEFHMEMRIRENIAAGMSPEEAQRSARARLGELEKVRRQGRAIRRRGRTAGLLTRFAGDLRRDLGFAARGMLRAPAATAVALLALTLGIGATTAVFSVVDGVLLQAFPYEEPDRLVTAVGLGVRPETREQLEGLDTLSASSFFTISSPEMVGPAGAARGDGLLVGQGFFSTLGVRPARGRTLVADDYAADAQPVVVVTDRLWRDTLRERSDAVGSALMLDGIPHEIVGILPPGVTMLLYDDTDLFVPLAREPRSLMMLGRLRDGVTFEQGRQQALALSTTFGLEEEASALGRLAESDSAEPTLYYRTLYEQVVGADRTGLLLLAGAAALVLVIAAANVANLALAHTLARSDELAVRLALGAGRGRLLRQLLTESGLLATIGGALGTLAAFWGVPVLLSMSPAYLARADNVAVDLRALAFTACVTLAVGLLAGLVPVAFAQRPHARAVRARLTGTTPSRSGHRALAGLVAGEMALALIVLVATGLLVRAFISIRPVEPGFDASGKLVFEVRPAVNRYPDPLARSGLYERILAGLRGLPDAQDAAAISTPPLVGMVFPIPAVPEGFAGGSDDLPTVWLEHASANYHQLMRIAIVRGRGLQSPAAAGEEIVLSETAARSLFPDADPLGKRIRIELPFGRLAEAVADRIPGNDYTVVGIAADTLRLGNSRRSRPTVWIDFLSGDDRRMSFVVEARGRPQDLARPVRELLAEVDPLMPIEYLQTMDEVVYESASLPRFYMVLMGIFGGIATLLAVIGFYGVMAFSIGRRTRELGVRVALGASPRAIRRLVLVQGGSIVATGLVVGLAGCFAATRLLESLLYGVSPIDPPTYAALTALLAVTGLVACYLPARRATRVDPLVTLRQQ